MRPRTSPPTWLLPVIDALCVMLALPLAFYYRFHIDRIPIPGTEPPAFRPYFAALPVLVMVFLGTFAASRIYLRRRGQPLLDELFGITGASVFAAFVTLAFMSLYRGFSYSRLVLLYTMLAAVLLIGASRILLRRLRIARQRRGIGTDRVLVVGTGAGSQLLIRRMTMFPEFGYQVVGVLDDGMPVGTAFAGTRVLGPVSELANQVAARGVNQIFLALPGATHDQLLHLIKTCDDLQVDFRMLPDLFEIITTRVEADVVDGIPLVGVRRSQVTGFGLGVKRTFDLVVSVSLLIILLPVLVLLAAAIKVSSRGPIFYRQERVGKEGRLFTVIKFRSMVADAEAQTGPVFASRHDTRRTAVGRFVRRISLDELPQLINIIRGEMSLVGPRPERPHFVERFGTEIPRYLERHQVSPGVTGWAQVNDLRGDTSIADRTIYDIYYVENWSLAFDIKIILLTLGRVFFQRHAY